MRRAAIAVAMLVALLLPAGVATAGWSGYSGTFERGGELSFGLEKRHGKRYVMRWKWRDFPVECADGPQITGGKYLFRLRVRKRVFDGGAVLLSGSGRVVGGAKVQGEFGPGYETADGTFRVYGRTPEGHRDCQSRRTPWTAARDVTPVRRPHMNVPRTPL